MAPSQTPASPQGEYKQQLNRNIGVIQAVGITVSGISPIASVFIIAPVVYDQQGSGVALSSLIAAVICFGMAFCYSELGAAFPVAGADYAVVTRVLGRPIGFLAFVDFLVLAVVGTSSIGLGTAPYVESLWKGPTPQIAGIEVHVVGVSVLVLAMLIALVSIKSNAWVTGGFLLLQFAAVAVICVLGFGHAHQPVSLLVHPQDFSHGRADPVSVGVIMAGVALAITVYNGYDGALSLSEEIVNPRKNVPRAVNLSLALAAGAAFLPIIATVIGAPSLRALTTEANPLSYVIRSDGGHTVETMVTLAIILAIFNSAIVGMVSLGRVIYSSARDKAWPGPINGWLSYINPRYKTPMAATIFIGLLGAGITAFTNIAEVITFAAFLLVVLYFLVAAAALVSRFTQPHIERPYRMPLWPVPPLVALAGCAIVASQQHVSDMIVVAVILAAGLAYYLLYLRPRAATHWIMLKPADDQPAPEPVVDSLPLARVGAEPS